VNFLTAIATAFVLIVPVELPDKTFLATIMLTTRYKPLAVWLGVATAFLVQCAVAVAAGKLLTLLPHDLVQWIVAVMFAVFAVLLFRSARQAHLEEDSDEETPPVVHRGGARAYGASFIVLFAAEWGDLSQLLTAGLVAKGYDPFAVLIGSWFGLCAVSGAAVLIGRALLKRVRPSRVTYVAAALCAIFAVITVVSAAT
jgi:putative Ca2+/H+ antiporter (TMEM165/GDT1 family)